VDLKSCNARCLRILKRSAIMTAAALLGVVGAAIAAAAVEAQPMVPAIYEKLTWALGSMVATGFGFFARDFRKTMTREDATGLMKGLLGQTEERITGLQDWVKSLDKEVEKIRDRELERKGM